MQTNGGLGAYASEGLGNHSVMDGVDDCGTGVTNGVSNGECMAAAEVKTTLTKSQQEVIRLIGQFLRNLGLTLVLLTLILRQVYVEPCVKLQEIFAPLATNQTKPLSIFSIF